MIQTHARDTASIARTIVNVVSINAGRTIGVELDRDVLGQRYRRDVVLNCDRGSGYGRVAIVVSHGQRHRVETHVAAIKRTLIQTHARDTASIV